MENPRERRNSRQRKNYRKKLRAVRLLKRLIGPCTVCGAKYPPVAMHFHHRNPAEKLANVSDMLRGYSWKMIVTEIRKCDLVCAVCHALETERHREAA